MRLGSYFVLFVALGAIVSRNADAQTYCTAAGNNISYESISSVTVNGVTNTSGAAYYSDFTGVAFGVDKGSSANISFSAAGGYPESWAVFIDYNRNGTFETNERVVGLQSAPAGTVSASFAVPVTALSGRTRMRVAMSYGTIPSACGTFTYGEVEDYSIDVKEGTVTLPPTSYCRASAQNSSLEWIAGVSTATFNNASNFGPGYEDFTALSGLSAAAGEYFTVRVTPGYLSAKYPVRVSGWVDFNENGSFDDSGEQVFSTSSSITGTSTYGVRVPSATKAGKKRFRIVLSDYYSSAPAPCISPAYGQVEDYTIEVKPGVPVTSATISGTLPSVSGITVMLSLGTGETRTIIANNWNYSFTNVPIGATYTVTPSRYNMTFSPSYRTGTVYSSGASASFGWSSCVGTRGVDCPW